MGFSFVTLTILFFCCFAYQTSETEDTADDTPPTPNNSASTPIPEVTADEKGSEHTTQADGKPAASFDESLDQFYDVLSGLTTS